MLRGQLPTRPGRHPDDEGNRELSAGHMAQRRSGIHNLIESKQTEVHRHDFHDRAESAQRSADPDADKAQLRQGSVAYAFGAELLEQFLGSRIGSAVPADVLAHQQDPWIVAQGVTHRVVNCGSICRFHVRTSGARRKHVTLEIVDAFPGSGIGEGDRVVDFVGRPPSRSRRCRRW